MSDGRDALRNRQQLRHLLGDPEPAVGLEGVGRPERGALLLLAAVAVDGDGGVDQLADRDAGAAVVEGRAELGDDLPGLVAVHAAGDAEPVAGLRRGGDGLRLGPPAGRDAADVARRRARRALGLGAAAELQQGVGLAREDVRVACQLDQRDRIVEARTRRDFGVG